MTHPVLVAARIYANRGWPVLPCHSIRAGGCTCHQPDCASPAKHPRIAGGLRSATTDLPTIERWWARWPHANVAIRTGAPSGLVVIDIDPRHGGDQTLRQLELDHGPLLVGRRITTGADGAHLYFAHPGGTIRNDAGRILGPGIDIRADGGYVLAPPSLHATGSTYRLDHGPRVIPPLPTWIIQALQPPAPHERPRHAPGSTARGTAWAQAALRGELQRLATARQGARNDTLNRVAFRVGQIIGAGLLSETSARDALVDQAIAIGLSQREANATAASGLTAGQRAPSMPSPDDSVGASL